MTLQERLQDNPAADSFCQKQIQLTDQIFADIEFNNDGTYCSLNCLLKHYKEIEMQDVED